MILIGCKQIEFMYLLQKVVNDGIVSNILLVKVPVFR